MMTLLLPHRVLLPAVAAISLAAALPAAAQQTAEAAVDAVFARWNNAASPGCAVGVTRDGRSVLTRAYGMADLEQGVPNAGTTIFEAGSVSKQLTAAAVMLLVQERTLALDADIREWVPELPDYGEPITIRHLLNHTSGLRDWGSVAAIRGLGRGERTHDHDHVLDILARQRSLNHPPGAEYSYTNSGYNLAVIIVERAIGGSFADFSRRRIFEPLGMHDTQWRDDYRRIVPRRATAYSMEGGNFVIDRPIEHVHGHAGLLTTVADLLTWNEALAAGRLGGQAFVDLMHRRGILTDGREIAYASGISIGSHRGVREVAHTGATSGYRAVLLRYPDPQVGVTVLCNAGNVDAGAIGHRVAELFLGDVLRPVAAEEPAQRSERAAVGQSAAELAAFGHSAAELAAFAGEYYSVEAETSLVFRVHEGWLVAHRRPARQFPLTPVSRDVFDSELGRVTFPAHGGRRHHAAEPAAVPDLGPRLRAGALTETDVTRDPVRSSPV